MSLNVYIKYNGEKRANYFLDHPYIYNGLTQVDYDNFSIDQEWSANITHNLGGMASKVPVNLKDGTQTTLYYACWRPKEILDKPNTNEVLDLLIQGLIYMIEHRKELLQYESPNGWGTYNGFMKFLLNYKQACEDNLNCEIEVSR